MPAAFRLEGLDAFKKAMGSFVEACERDITGHVKDLAYRITFNLVMETPQYSGAAASAWRVGLGSPDYVTEKPFFRVPDVGPGVGDKPYSRNENRNMAAVNQALALCSFEIGMYTLRDGPLYISNGLDYATWFPRGEHAPGKALRALNMPQRGIGAVVRDSLNPSSVLRF